MKNKIVKYISLKILHLYNVYFEHFPVSYCCTVLIIIQPQCSRIRNAHVYFRKPDIPEIPVQ